MSQMNILLVDDDRIVLDYLSGIMQWEQYGFTVCATAVNGKQGLVAYERHHPEIILTDIKMPFMDGLDMLTQIKSHGQLTHFVILTAYGEFSYAQEAIRLGAYGFLLKDELSKELLLDTLLPVKEDIIKQTELVFALMQKEIGAILGDTADVSTTLRRMGEYLTPIQHRVVEESQIPAELDRMMRRIYMRAGKGDFYRTADCECYQDIKMWLEECLSRLEKWGTEEKLGISPVISNVRQMIERDYGEKDLSIQTIADRVQLSPNWLSALFKREMGNTINDYITETRIANAKELLLQGTYKVYEIADMVGYGSSQYFSKVFAQATGHTPQSYRKEPDHDKA